MNTIETVIVDSLDMTEDCFVTLLEIALGVTGEYL